MPRISELPTTNYPSLEHRIPASKEGETVVLTLEQVKSVLALQSQEISFRAGNVYEALAQLIDAPEEDTSEELVVIVESVAVARRYAYDLNLHYGS